ncbi:MAG: type II secretion system protein GspD [bacterium]
MKKTLIAIIILIVGLQGAAYAQTGGAIILPPLKTFLKHKERKKVIPAALMQRVSLSGNMSVKQALFLLARQVDFPFVPYAGLKTADNIYYFKDIPLYQALNIILAPEGFIYKYQGGELDVYGELVKTVHLPVSDLSSSYESVIGMSGMNSGSSAGQNNTPSAVPQTTAGTTGTTGTINPAATTPQMNGLANGTNNSNPGGILSLSLASSGESLSSLLSKNLKIMLGKSGQFFINQKNGIIWMKGRSKSVVEAVDYLKAVKKDLSRLVFLQVEVLDITLNNNFQYGINWNLLFNDAFKSNPLGTSAVSVGANMASLAGVNVGSPNITFSGSAGANQAVINALKSQGTVSVVSQPRLMLTDGQTRLISSSTTTPYVSNVQVLSYGVSGQLQTYPQMSQVQTGFSIAYTAHISKNNDVSVTVSLIDNNITGYQTFSYSDNTFTNPIIQAKAMTDTVTVKSGRTAIIGGILTKNKNKQNYGIPILSSIPIIGALFAGVNNTYTKDDLVIMLTPRIITKKEDK